MSLIRILKNSLLRGPKTAIISLLRTCDVKYGRLIGEDKLGNKYYESSLEVVGRQRWVEYPTGGYDASQVPPAWHPWLHYITDQPPSEEINVLPKQPENYTGSNRAYRPYNTTKPKFEFFNHHHHQ